MKKPLFLKATLVSNQVIFLPISGQTTEERAGKLINLAPTIQVIPKIPVACEEGEIYATDTITSHPKGWYVAGSFLYKITDSTGITVDGLGELHITPEHQTYIDAYMRFANGEEEEELTPEGKKKPRPVKYMQTIKADKRFTPPTIEDDGWYVDTDTWYHLIRNYAKRKNTLLVGDSGAGKTELVRLLMRKLGKRLEIFDMAISNPSKVLCGNLRATNGSTHYQYARFAKSIQKEGAVLLDEISRANPTANNILLPVLDGRRTLYIEDAITDSEIELHEKCTVMATANIGTKFIGTNTLDHALLNRFSQVGIEYPPTDQESLLLQKVWGISKMEADTLVAVADNIRNHEEISKDISTRQLMEIAELVSDGYTRMDAFKWSILQQFEHDKGDGGERQEVLSIIGSY